MNEIGEVKRVTSSGSLRVEVPRFLCKHDIVLRIRVFGAILYKFQKGYFVKLDYTSKSMGLAPILRPYRGGASRQHRLLRAVFEPRGCRLPQHVCLRSFLVPM